MKKSRRKRNTNIRYLTSPLHPEVHINKPANTLHQQTHPPPYQHMPWHIEASRLPQHLSLSSSLMPTPTHRKHSVAPFKQQAFLPTTGTVAHNNICGFFHGPASLCNLCTTWESVTEHSKDKIVPIPPFAMWRPNTSNCSLLKAICSFLPGG